MSHHQNPRSTCSNGPIPCGEFSEVAAAVSSIPRNPPRSAKIKLERTHFMKCSRTQKFRELDIKNKRAKSKMKIIYIYNLHILYQAEKQYLKPPKSRRLPTR